jgi:Ca-activated chloride channel family protein
MNILWPGFLLLLGLIPLIVAAYIWVLRRRRRFAVRYSSLALVRAAQPHKSRWRRHLPFGLFLVALSCLVFAMGRPVATVSLPNNQTAVILALDVSRSMCQTDIAPNRFEAAKSAAMSFIESQEPGTQIGIVAFAGFAELIAVPTNDQDVLRTALERLAPGRRTAIGSGILKSLDAIAEIFDDVAASGADLPPGMESPQLLEGEYAPYIIVLLTDGVSNSGLHPLDAAQQAVDRGVRVYTIGFGTSNAGGPIPFCGPGFEQGDPFGQQFGGGGGGGGGLNRGIDEETLKQVSAMTGGEYYSAESADQLNQVFQNLPSYAIIEQEHMEISVFFTALGAALAALAILLSLVWHPLP